MVRKTPSLGVGLGKHKFLSLVLLFFLSNLLLIKYIKLLYSTTIVLYRRSNSPNRTIWSRQVFSYYWTSLDWPFWQARFI